MPRKTKDVIQKSYVRVQLTLDVPVTYGEEVNDIRKLVADENVYALVSDYPYDVEKMTSTVIHVDEEVPPMPEVKNAA